MAITHQHIHQACMCFSGQNVYPSPLSLPTRLCEFLQLIVEPLHKLQMSALFAFPPALKAPVSLFVASFAVQCCALPLHLSVFASAGCGCQISRCPRLTHDALPPFQGLFTCFICMVQTSISGKGPDSCLCLPLFQHRLLTTPSLSSVCLWFPTAGLVAQIVGIYFWDFCSAPLVCTFALVSALCYFNLMLCVCVCVFVKE